MRTHLLISSLVAAATLTAACDDKKPPATTEKSDSPRPERPFESAGTKPLEATGEVADDGWTLEWKHTFDGNEIVDAALCKQELLTVTNSGRIVSWAPDKMVPLGVISNVGTASAIDVRGDEAVIGTTTGDFVAGDCRFAEPSPAANSGFEVIHLTIDPRAKMRALVIMRRPGEEDESDRAMATHVDLHSGKGLRKPYEVDIAAGAEIQGFVDYKGELWLAATTDERTRVWYLERFDSDQPLVRGLDDGQRLAGFTQVRGEVWGYGRHEGDGKGLIARIDASAKVKTIWDGEKAWFGEQPGGDIPSGEPVTGVIQDGDQLYVLTPASVRRTDIDMRRWRVIPAASGATSPLQHVRGTYKVGDGFVVATANGLARITKDEWKLWRLPQYDAPKDQFTAFGAGAIWNDAEYTVNDGVLSRTRPNASKDEKKPHRVREEVVAAFVDGADQLWVLGREHVYLLMVKDNGDVDKKRWKNRAIGIDPARATGFAPSRDGGSIALRMRGGDVMKLRPIATNTDAGK